MKIDSRLSEDDLRATILAVLRKVSDGDFVKLPTLLRDLTEAVKRALETGEAQREL